MTAAPSGRSTPSSPHSAREAAKERGVAEVFDGSIVALRKFTSSEFLDVGFNLSMVSQRQGHGPHVLVKHDARSRPSADRKAADHLGQVVHRRDEPQAERHAAS